MITHPCFWTTLGMFGWFLMSIGAAAYIPLEDPRPTPFGLTTRLGWAPEWKGRVSPFVAFRSDWVFRDRIQTLVSVDAGLTFAF